jgi:hypothetical protein
MSWMRVRLSAWLMISSTPVRRTSHSRPDSPCGVDFSPPRRNVGSLGSLAKVQTLYYPGAHGFYKARSWTPAFR